MHQRYGSERLALGGGCFMNVKANMRLAREEWVHELFVAPSCGDESNAIGAAYLGYLELCRRRGARPRFGRWGPPISGPAWALRMWRRSSASATWRPATG
jgi:predicted NodU family carbamoyl transferase